MPLVRNNIVEYDPHEGIIRVCRNYIHSKQLLREEFARENQILSDHLI